MPQCYAPFFMGQFGFIFSMGVVRMASRARELGIEAEVFSYGDVDKAAAAIVQHKFDNPHCLIAGVGYSLGVSALTWLQTQKPFDLVLCLAGSKLGMNYHINRITTKRAVLWRGPDTLSSWGGFQGFDQVIDVNAMHLWFDFDDTVVEGVQRELQFLMEDGTSPRKEGISQLQRR